MATWSLRVRRLISPTPQALPLHGRNPGRRCTIRGHPKIRLALRRRGNRESYLTESEAHRNTAGEEKACPLQCVDHGATGGPTSGNPSACAALHVT
ncbi:hypothetical protein G5714_009997 [Onychostoma macrolepis]|uniref:Uncharacterized protein n=1 Tax=Onychostoma macrolepis TaxID=369639 RepID=A0A7J6CPC2_9TELE|nr:hypothetical protein G5714_009997 [Onychostoma macrolepis]